MALNEKRRVHVTGDVPRRVAEALEQDFELVSDPAEAEGVLSLINTVVDDAYLERAGAQLEVVANYGVGVNNIDLEAARRRGVVIANTPDVLTKTTAELAIAVTLALLRRVVEGDRFIRSRSPWSFSLEFMLGEGLDGKTFGIVGAGRIGRETARLAEAFGARPIFSGRNDPLDELLAVADVVSLHCPLTPETRHLIDETALAAMKRSAVLVNTARGPIVDERALVDALRQGSHRRGRAGRLRVRAGGQRRAARAGPGGAHTTHGQRHTEHAGGHGNARGRRAPKRADPQQPPPTPSFRRLSRTCRRG